MGRRTTTVVGGTLLALALTGAPAWAHAGFDVTQVPPSETVDVELRVPIEIDAGNQRIAVLVPAGWTVDGCAGAPGWDCGFEQRDDSDTVVNLARADGDPGTERFTITVTAAAAEGTYTFPVVQSYDDGTEAAWIGEPGGDRPAPTIQVGDDSTPIERDSALPTHDDASGTDTASASETPATEPPATDPAASDAPSPSASASVAAVADPPTASRDVPWPAIGVGLLVLAGVIGAVVARRR